MLRARMEWRDEEGTLHRRDGMIRDMSRRGLSVDCDVELGLSQVVDIEDSRGHLARFAVRNCSPNGQGRFRLGLMQLDRERRRELRFPASGTARLHRVGDGATPEIWDVEIRDVSESGMRIVSPRSIASGEAVKLVGVELVCLASTRYCIEDSGAYLVGLQFMGRPTDGSEPEGRFRAAGGVG